MGLFSLASKLELRLLVWLSASESASLPILRGLKYKRCNVTTSSTQLSPSDPRCKLGRSHRKLDFHKFPAQLDEPAASLRGEAAVNPRQDARTGPKKQERSFGGG